MPAPKCYSAYPVPTPERVVLARSPKEYARMIDLSDPLAVKHASQASRKARLSQHEVVTNPVVPKSYAAE